MKFYFLCNIERRGYTKICCDVESLKSNQIFASIPAAVVRLVPNSFDPLRVSHLVNQNLSTPVKIELRLFSHQISESDF